MADIDDGRKRGEASPRAAGETVGGADLRDASFAPPTDGFVLSPEMAERARASIAERTSRRDAGIERLMADARALGQPADRIFMEMVYDFEVAPLTTNRRQLAAFGLEFPRPEEVDDRDLPRRLRELVGGLALLRVFLINTDHMTDRDLFRRLVDEVLDEEVRDVAGIEGVCEWVDLGSLDDDKPRPIVVERDRWLPNPRQP